MAPVPTVGAAGVAWGKDDGEGLPDSESYLGAYTEPAVVTSGRFGSGLGEPGVSKKSQGNRDQSVCTPASKQTPVSKQP